LSTPNTAPLKHAPMEQSCGVYAHACCLPRKMVRINHDRPSRFRGLIRFPLFLLVFIFDWCSVALMKVSCLWHWIISHHRSLE
jgi:hypothetical protein